MYAISGPLFFGTMTYFIEQFHFTEDPEQSVIDLSRSHVWDHSAVAAISKVVSKYRQLGKHVSIEGLNKESQSLVDRIGLSVPSGHEKAWEAKKFAGERQEKAFCTRFCVSECFFHISSRFPRHHDISHLL